MLGYAIWRAENLSKLSFYLDTHRFRQLSFTPCKQKFSQAVNDNLGWKTPDGVVTAHKPTYRPSANLRRSWSALIQ